MREQFGDRLRTSDPDRYLSILYAPPDKRPALTALYAFDAEVASVRDRVTEPLPGEIRLQWWRDTLLAGMPTGNPLADALNDAIRLNDLPRHAFDNLLAARVFDLYDDPMPSRHDLEGYLGETEGAVIQLAALVLDRDVAADHAALAGHAGCARGVAGILRHLPRHRARGQCFVPGEILAAVGSTPEAFNADHHAPAARSAVEAMTALGRQHFAAFDGGAYGIPLSLRPAFLPLAVTRADLRRQADPKRLLDDKAQGLSVLKRQWLILKAALGGWPRR